MAHSKAKLRGNGDKSISLFQTIPNKKHVRQILAYPDSAIHFSLTQFYYLYQFHGDTKLNENIIYDLPSNWIIHFLEVYKELIHKSVVIFSVFSTWKINPSIWYIQTGTHDSSFIIYHQPVSRWSNGGSYGNLTELYTDHMKYSPNW